MVLYDRVSISVAGLQSEYLLRSNGVIAMAWIHARLQSPQDNDDIWKENYLNRLIIADIWPFSQSQESIPADF